MSTFDEIVSAIRSLPLAERLRIAEQVIHEAAASVPAPVPEPATDGEESAELVEVGRLLIVKSRQSFPADMFDHRALREERLQKLSTGQ
jgi:hypothetical protein